MKITKTELAKVDNQFNRLSEKLGCSIRIESRIATGRGAKVVIPVYFKVIGIDTQGFEVIQKIETDIAIRIISKYDELCYFQYNPEN